MAYNRFTIESIRKTFGIRILGDVSLFDDVVPVAPSVILAQFLDRYLPLGSVIVRKRRDRNSSLLPFWRNSHILLIT